MSFLALPKNTAAVIPIPLYLTDGSGPYAGDDPVAGDVKVYKDGAAPANITSLPTSQDNIWKVSLTASELNADFINIWLIDQSDPMEWLPACLTITTLDPGVVRIMQTTIAELSAVPAAAATPEQILQFLFMLSRNKLTSTSTEQKLFKDDGSTVAATFALSDDGSTFTRGEAV